MSDGGAGGHGDHHGFPTHGDIGHQLGQVALSYAAMGYAFPEVFGLGQPDDDFMGPPAPCLPPSVMSGGQCVPVEDAVAQIGAEVAAQETDAGLQIIYDAGTVQPPKELAGTVDALNNSGRQAIAGNGVPVLTDLSDRDLQEAGRIVVTTVFPGMDPAFLNVDRERALAIAPGVERPSPANSPLDG